MHPYPCQESGSKTDASDHWRQRWDRALKAGDRLRWAVRVRWLVILGFFALAVVADRLGGLVSLRACTLGASAACVLNAINHWCVSRQRHVGLVTGVAVLADQVIITYVVAHSGGVESPFVMMYVVQVVASAMLVDELAAAVTATWAIVLWAILLGLQFAGLFAIPDLGGARQVSPLLYQAIWVAFLLYSLGLLTYVGGHLARRLSRSEEHLAERNRELQDALASLEGTYQQLRQAEGQLAHAEKMRGLGQLVAGVAHELNNPISFISANVEHVQRYAEKLAAMLASYEAAAERPEMRDSVLATRRQLGLDRILEDLPLALADCQEGARRSKRIIDDLRSFARGDGAERWQHGDIHAGLDSALRLLAHRTSSRIGVHREYGAHGDIECLPAQLNQVFLNLLANALDAVGEQAGNIWIRTRLVSSPPTSEARVEIEIRDDGCGMSAEVQARALEPFYTTKPVGAGTGLGLSICLGIVERHRGTLRFSSTAGEGCTFTLSLPRRHGCEASGDASPA